MIVRGHYQEQLNALHQQLATMGVMVEDAVSQSLLSLRHKNGQMAKRIIHNDRQINEKEVSIETNCFSLIALQQPVGTDLRQIAITLKIAADLERIADHAVNVAKIAYDLQDDQPSKLVENLLAMGGLVETMLEDSLAAYIGMDQHAAVQVAEQDNAIDVAFENICTELLNQMSGDQELIKQSMQLLLVSQYLERIGDYATNICEWIVYMKEGKLVDLNR